MTTRGGEGEPVDGDESSTEDEPRVGGELEQLLRAVAAAPDVPLQAEATASLATGTVVGDTYRIESRLGEGAMGVVWLATDLALDRQVALKVHQRSAEDPGHSRMWREAKAMARLSHPNVLTVHEVGVHEGRVYIAMERVEGGTLRQWLGRQRSWSEIVDVFVQAAHGLAAAHDVGLVHRDFKPSNVLIGNDGRVRVADFGLARASDESGTRPTVSAPSPERSPALDDSVTAVGATVGTPAYMAPEQRAEGVADARSDQFSFFVSLHEALHGVRPAVGDSRTARSAAEVSQGGSRASLRRVPPWLQSIVDRGLSIDPASRHPDLHAVAAALRDDPTRRRRAVAGAFVVLALGGTVWGGTSLLERRERAGCESEASAIATEWDDATRGRVVEAFVATGLPYAQATVAHMDPFVRAYSQQWRTLYEHGCVAAHVDGSQDLSRWQAAQGCLHGRRQILHDLVAVLAEAPDPAIVHGAVGAVAGLASLSTCDEDAWLARHPEEGEGATIEANRDLYRAAALLAAGRYEAALRLAQATRAAVADGDDLQLQAKATILAGEIALEVEPAQAAELLTEGFELAVAAGDDDRALEAATELVYAIGIHEHRPEEGLVWRRIARGLLHRLDAEEGEAAAALAANVGGVHEAQKQPELALAEHTRALEVQEARLGPHHPEVAYSRNNLGTTLVALARYDEAEAELSAAAEILEQALGPEHPEVGIAHNNLGSLYNRMGRAEDAERAHLRALDAFARAYGPEHPRTALSHNNLGNLYVGMKRWGEAQEHLQTALRILTRTDGPDHESLAPVLNHLGNMYLARGDLVEAERAHARALEIASEHFGAEDPRTASSQINLGRVYEATDRIEEAETLWTTAEATLSKVKGSDHPDTAAVQLHLARLGIRRRRFEDAARRLDRVVATLEGALDPAHPRIAEALVARAEARLGLGEIDDALADAERGVASSSDGVPRAIAQLVLARARWETPEDRGAARALAEAARATFAAADRAPNRRLAETDRWLAAHSIE